MTDPLNNSIRAPLLFQLDESEEDNTIELYEDAKSALVAKDTIFSKKRKTADMLLRGFRVLLLVLIVVFTVLLAKGVKDNQPISHDHAASEDFLRHLNQTYCSLTGGWTTASNCTLCDTTNFIHNSTTGSCVKCKDTRWGPHCQFRCPGEIDPGIPCHGHGTCDSGLFGTGQCLCEPGYRGSMGHACGFSLMLPVVVTFVVLFIVIMTPQSTHKRMFYRFFKSACCPTILVENELAMSELPTNMTRWGYASFYGGLLMFFVLPLLLENTTSSTSVVQITTTGGNQGNQGNSGNTYVSTPDVQLQVYLLLSLGMVTMLMIISLWELFSGLIRRATNLGYTSSRLRRARNNLSQDVHRLEQGWVILEEDVTIDRFIASGSYGRVSVGTWRCFPQVKVAIKEVYPTIQGVNINPDTGEVEETRLFDNNELQAMIRLRHRHLVFFFGAGQITPTAEENKVGAGRGKRFFVSEFCEHGDLDHYLQAQEGVLLPMPDIVRFASEICAGMNHLHANNFIHRDLKPMNILIQATQDSEGNVVKTLKICDFGLARLFCGGNANRSRSSSSTVGSALPGNRKKAISFRALAKENKDAEVDMEATTNIGTVPYMAPELFMSFSEEYGKPVDVYAYSMVLWELMASQRVWAAETMLSNIVKQVVGGLRPSTKDLATVPRYDALRGVMEASWCRRPKDRMTFVGIMEALQGLTGRWGEGGGKGGGKGGGEVEEEWADSLRRIATADRFDENEESDEEEEEEVVVGEVEGGRGSQKYGSMGVLETAT